MKVIKKTNITEINDCKEKLIKEGKKEVDGFYDINSLWKTVKKMKNFNDFAVFNGKILVFEENDTITEDDLFLAILGKTKKQHEDENKKWLKEYQDKEEAWKKQIPSLIPVYIEKGHKIIDEKYWKTYDSAVPIFLNSIYHEYILDCIIEIIELSKNNETFEKIENKFYEQGHSGATYNLTRRFFAEISDFGKNFYEYCLKKEENWKNQQ